MFRNRYTCVRCFICSKFHWIWCHILCSLNTWILNEALSFLVHSDDELNCKLPSISHFTITVSVNYSSKLQMTNCIHFSLFFLYYSGSSPDLNGSGLKVGDFTDPSDPLHPLLSLSYGLHSFPFCLLSSLHFDSLIAWFVCVSIRYVPDCGIIRYNDAIWSCEWQQLHGLVKYN